MTLLRNIKSLLDNPVRLVPYTEWVASKLIYGRPPILTLHCGARIGNWQSFSEYWSFHDLIPDSERKFFELCIGNRSDGRAVAFDIGANIGLFTCMMAASECHVHAFEPIPETFCRLKQNVKLNDSLNSVKMNCLAVGHDQGLVTFQIDAADAATNHLLGPSEARPSGQVSIQLVATISLDEYCAKQNIESIDFVKLDVEGMEPYVLQGARRLLAERRIKAFLIEICPSNLCSVGLSPAELYHEFQAAAYSPYALNEDGTPGAKLSLSDIQSISLTNVALLPDY